MFLTVISTQLLSVFWVHRQLTFLQLSRYEYKLLFLFLMGFDPFEKVETVNQEDELEHLGNLSLILYYYPESRFTFPRILWNIPQNVKTIIFPRILVNTSHVPWIPRIPSPLPALLVLQKVVFKLDNTSLTYIKVSNS